MGKEGGLNNTHFEVTCKKGCKLVACWISLASEYPHKPHCLSAPS